MGQWKGCVSFFCAVCLLEHARGKGVSTPSILSLGAPSLLACRLWCRRNRQGRRMRLLVCGLLFTKTLLLAGPTLEVVLVLTQAVLLLPGLRPALIEQRETQCEHGIDMLGSPMHAWSFETGLYHELMATLDTSRPNRPALLLVGRIVHQLAPDLANRSPAPGSAESAWLSG
jgi:hypothetical protein